MQFGIFDHVERDPARSLADQYDERLRFAAAADAAGFYALHVAEHHSSRLNMTPAPGIWLSALARATTRIRLGPLVYLLPLYSPLRLAEEICMLDHLSRGRIDVGVGRGVSPYEVGYHNLDHARSRDIFIDAWQCLCAALSGEEFSYESANYRYRSVPMTLRPLQQPHPPFWYGSSNTIGATWAGDHGMHFVANGPAEVAKPALDAFRAALAKRGGPAQAKAEFAGGTAIGLMRHVFVADSDAEAERIARPALEYHAASLNWLRKRHGDTEYTQRAGIHRSEGFADWRKLGMVIAGSPATVRAELDAQARTLGVNYLLLYPFFGTMSLPDALRSLDLFRAEVMPHLAKI